MRLMIVSLLIVFQVIMSSMPVQAAPFDPASVKISVEDSIWQQYHISNSSAVSGDVVKIYKLKKIEITLLSGDRVFGTQTFTPEDSKPVKFSLLHGVSNLKVRLKAYAAENVSWTSSFDYKDVGSNIEIKSLSTSFGVYYPGL